MFVFLAQRSVLNLKEPLRQVFFYLQNVVNMVPLTNIFAGPNAITIKACNTVTAV